MEDTKTWAWVGQKPLPGFSTENQNNLDGQWNGTAIDPKTYATIVWSDRDADGIFYDNDDDDDGYAGKDCVIIGGSEKTLHEVSLYLKSTMQIGDQTYDVALVAWVFTDGTYMFRIPDSQIPPGLSLEDVSGLYLGTWDQQEYSGNYSKGFDDPFVCFAAGTLIDTPEGPRAVESLLPGMLVCTADHGDQPLRWVGQRRVSAMGKMAPVRIAARALGNRRDLYVSPQHRMLIAGWQAELWFGEPEVLVPAAALINDRTIRRDPRGFVTYCHLLFDRHEIIFAEGAPSESFHPMAAGLAMLDRAQRDEVLDLFPELSASAPWLALPAARPTVCMFEGRVLRN